MSIIEEYEGRLKEEQVLGTFYWIKGSDWEKKASLREYIIKKIETQNVKLTRKQEAIQSLVLNDISSILDPPKTKLAIEAFDEEEIQEVIAFYQLEKPEKTYKEIRSRINGPENFMTRIPYEVIHELYKRKIVPFDRQIFVGCLVRYNVWHGGKYNKELPESAKDKLLTFFPTDEFTLDILMAVFEMELGVSTAFYLEREFNIGGLIIALTGMGILERNTIHAKILEAFNNPSLKQTTHGWVRNIHKDLAFTTEELLEHQENYHNLLHNDRNLLANYGLQILKKLTKNPAFNWESLSNNLEGIVYREKFNSGFNLALDLLLKHFKKDTSLLEQTCVNLAPIFIQPEPKIQSKAKAIYEMISPTDEVKAALIPYVDTMHVDVKKDLSAFLEGHEEEDVSMLVYKQEAYVPPSLNEIEEVNFVEKEEDFIFLVSKVLKSQDFLDYELFLEGILKFHYLGKSKLRELSPALKQAKRLLSNEYFPTATKAGAHHFMIANLICIWLDPSTATFEQDKAKCLEAIKNGNAYTAKQWLLFYKMMSRITYVASLFRETNKLPLLSSPTHVNGQIDPKVFFERLAQYNEAKVSPHQGDFNTAMCRLNRWTPFDHTIAKESQNKEYYSIIDYLLNAKQSFDFKQIKSLENCWLTAFAIKNPNKAIDGIIAYQEKKVWWEELDLTSWKVGRRYSESGDYSWSTFHLEIGRNLDDELKRDCYFGNHFLFDFQRIADVSHWFHRDLFFSEPLYLNFCQRHFKYLSDFDAENVKQIMATINHAVQHFQPIGKMGHLFMSVSLFCGDRAIRASAFDWLCQLIEEKILSLEWFVSNVKTILVNQHYPIPLPRAIAQFIELKQLGAEYLYVLKCILVEILEDIDVANLPKGFSKILNLYYEVSQMTDTNVSEAIRIQLERMSTVSTVKKEAKKILNC